MKKTVFALIAACLISGAAAAQTMPSLSQAFFGLRKALVPASAALKISAKIPRTASFNLEWRNHRWHMVPDPNPPFSDLRIQVYERQQVHLALSNLAVWNQDDGASFDVDGIDARINGRPSHGIHVWLPVAVGRATVDFVAPKEGIYLVYASYSGTSDGPIGEIIVLKP